MKVKYVRKRTGRVVPYDSRFIARAIHLAAASAGDYDEEAAAQAVMENTQQLRRRVHL